ncbi:hypothetical protein [Vibrio parahaemolyticus]|jgi:hypothetical protein|uniref:hypothetical protein n=1 Tax=Vibrio parahaemolyticus TaxID=670 RepID=UPI001E5F52FD|nr:hypothetical protein [Vibrio parahaemolyticus]
MSNKQLAVNNAVEILECALKESKEDVVMSELINSALNELKSIEPEKRNKLQDLPSLCLFVLKVLGYISNL